MKQLNIIFNELMQAGQYEQALAVAEMMKNCAMRVTSKKGK